jgi:hypothetical protein
MNYYNYLRENLGDAYNDAQKRWVAAKVEIGKSTYTADNWTNDLLHVWFGFMQPFWNVWAASAECPLPVVAFNTKEKDKDTKPTPTCILGPSGTAPPVVTTDLVTADGKNTVPAKDVIATVLDSVLTVNLQNLSALPAGNYQGAVYFGGTVNRVIALVELVIAK